MTDTTQPEGTGTEAAAHQSVEQQGASANLGGKLAELEAKNKALSDKLADAGRFQKKLEEIEAAQQEAEQAELVKKGEFEKMLTQRNAELEELKATHEAKEATLKAYEDSIKAINDKDVSDLKKTFPKEAFTLLEKKLEGLSAFKAQEEISIYKSLSTNPAFKVGNPGQASTDELTDAEKWCIANGQANLVKKKF